MTTLEDYLECGFNVSCRGAYSGKQLMSVESAIPVGLKGFVKNEGTDIEIPIYLGGNFIKEIVENQNIEEYIIPLYIENFTWNYKSAFTANKLLTACFHTSLYTLKKFKLDDEIYYGNRGILLNRDFNIIFLFTCSLKAEADGFDNLKISKLENCTVYYSPNIFIDSKDPVHKAIIKKLLPIICEKEFFSSIHIFNIFNSHTKLKPKLKIENVDNFIVKNFNPTILTNKEIQYNILDYLIQ